MNGVFRSEAGKRLLDLRYQDYLNRWAVPAEHRVVRTRRGDTFVIACGPEDAPPAVFLHGAGTNSTIWLADAALWSQTRRIYLVDVIGEPGRSAESRPPLDSDAYAEWLDDVLDGLGADRAAFVGASFGGWLATDYAIRRPLRVERLALHAPGGIGRQRYGAVLAALLLTPFGDRGRRLALRNALGAPTDLDDFVRYLAVIQKHYRPRRDPLPTFTDGQLRALTAPLRVTVGAQDRMLETHETALRLRKLAPHADIAVLAGTGHAITSDGEALRRFLDDGVSP